MVWQSALTSGLRTHTQKEARMSAKSRGKTWSTCFRGRREINCCGRRENQCRHNRYRYSSSQMQPQHTAERITSTHRVFTQWCAYTSPKGASQIRWNTWTGAFLRALEISTKFKTGQGTSRSLFVVCTTVLWAGACSSECVQTFSRKHSRIALWRMDFLLNSIVVQRVVFLSCGKTFLMLSLSTRLLEENYFQTSCTFRVSSPDSTQAMSFNNANEYTKYLWTVHDAVETWGSTTFNVRVKWCSSWKWFIFNSRTARFIEDLRQYGRNSWWHWWWPSSIHSRLHIKCLGRLSVAKRYLVAVDALFVIKWR